MQKLLDYTGNGGLDDITFSLDVNADINIQSKNDKTTLMLAVWDGNTKIINRLIQSGADLFIKDKDDKTALGIAKKRIRAQITELIKQRMEMEQKCNINNTSIYNMSRWF